MGLDRKGVQKPGTMVQLGEPVATIGEAHGAERELAEDANTAARLGTSRAGPEFHRIAEEPVKRRSDPDFASAFYAAMDRVLVENLPFAVVKANAPSARDDGKVFGSAFTTAVNAEIHGQFTKDDPTAVFNRALILPA